MYKGYVRIWRSIEAWEWYTTRGHAHLFQHLIRKANHIDKRHRGMEILRGQVVTGRALLAKETGLSERSIRTIIKHLKTTSEVTIKSTSIGSIITIVNYNSYQCEKKQINQRSDQRSDQQVTSERPASDQQVTTNKNGKNEKNKKKGTTSTSEALRLAKLLRSLILDRQPKALASTASMESWAKHIDLLFRRNKRNPEEVERVIRWCQQDSFWKCNILSTKKLREKFDQLEAKGNAEKRGEHGHGQRQNRDYDNQTSSVGCTIEA